MRQFQIVFCWVSTINLFGDDPEYSLKRGRTTQQEGGREGGAAAIAAAFTASAAAATEEETSPFGSGPIILPREKSGDNKFDKFSAQDLTSLRWT